jgi:hypothetical protein
VDLKQEFELRLIEFKNKILAVKRENTTAAFLLFKDYLSKMYDFYNALGIENQWDSNIYKTKEGHNLVGLIAPHLSIETIDLETFRVNYLNDITINKSKYTAFEYIFIYYSICWDIFKSYPEFENYKHLANPYDSVNLIFWRGNHISKGEMSTIEIDNLTVKKQFDFKLPSLDVTFLDYIDTVCHRSGSEGIPNQEKVNVLWDTFKLI